jgi:hypothetical protein
MGNYIPFDRKKAEAYARTLRKRQQREQKKAEDKFVSDQSMIKQVTKKIEANRNNRKESVVKVREPKPKSDHATIALQMSLNIIHGETAFKIKFLTGAVRVGDKEIADYVNTKRKRYLSRTANLAYHRYTGVIATGPTARRLHKCSEQAMKLSEKAVDILHHEVVSSMISIRMIAREEIKLLSSEERREILDMWNLRRKLYKQIGESASTNAKWLHLISRSYDPSDTTIIKLSR